jgi:hypothetical protein
MEVFIQQKRKANSSLLLKNIKLFILSVVIGTLSFNAYSGELESLMENGINNIIVVNDAGSDGANVDFDILQFDGLKRPSLSKRSGEFFPIGNTEVLLSGVNENNQVVTTSFTVMVIDIENPTITGVKDIYTVNDPLSGGAYVYWDIQAMDNSGYIDINYSHNPGEFFSIGETEVKINVSDAHGNVQIAYFKVSVIDIEDPTLEEPEDIYVLTAIDSEMPQVYFDLVATDNSNRTNIWYSIPSGTRFPIGQTQVKVNVSDPSGNVDIARFNVVVVNNGDQLIESMNDLGKDLLIYRQNK